MSLNVDHWIAERKDFISSPDATPDVDGERVTDPVDLEYGDIIRRVAGDDLRRNFLAVANNPEIARALDDVMVRH